MRKVGFYCVAALALVIALIQVRFLLLPLGDASSDMQVHATLRPLYFWAHVVASPIALAAGVAQFLPGLRSRRPALHRWTGRLYGVAVLVGGSAGLVVALGANGGPVAQVGFAALAALWLGCTYVALRHAVARRIPQHRRWMTRSYALTLAAVTLRLEIPILTLALSDDYIGVLPIIAWPAGCRTLPLPNG